MTPNDDRLVSPTPQPMRFGTPDDAEELARAEAYGVLALLFAAAPSAEFHAQLRMAPTEAPSAGGFLEASFSELVAAARRLSTAAIADEYDALFQALGKPDIYLYGSVHIAGVLHDRPLVALRDELATLGLTRAPGSNETEDHIAAMCEVMRYLIAGDNVAVCNLERQRHFFDDHLRPWSDRLWDAISAHPKADFYRAAAGFSRDFFAVEAQAFDMLG